MLPEVKRIYAAGKLIPFVGAGASRAVSWERNGTTTRGPSWNDLVEHAARIMGFEDPRLLLARGTPLQILEYFRLREGSLARLTNWLFSELQAPDDVLSKSRIHQALASLRNARLFYTTNYDDYLERSIAFAGRPCRAVVDERHMAPTIEECEVVKFHGDFNHPQKMVLSESDYDERLAFQTPLDLRLRSDMLGRVILFIGYSFRDPNVSYLFHLVQKHLSTYSGGFGRRAYILLPSPSDFETQLFAVRNIGVIPIDSVDPARAIAEFLEEVAAE